MERDSPVSRTPSSFSKQESLDIDTSRIRMVRVNCSLSLITEFSPPRGAAIDPILDRIRHPLGRC
jgi:hypothetical protein